jgi:hypothetical protein
LRCASISFACYNSRILLFCTYLFESGVFCATNGLCRGLLLFLFAIPVLAQTTQGLISGRLVDSRTGRAVSAATIEYQSQSTGDSGTSKSDPGGFYYLPLLSPGLYSIRADATGYQGQELQELDLPVAARLEVNFRLRPLSDVWESGLYKSVFLPGTQTIVTFYGPDVDTSRSGTFEGQQGKRGTLESAVSAVIDPNQIQQLPLAGRDVYTMLVALPGVTADTGTARGLGVAVNGQRPTSSNYLLDGLENNNYLITGPLTAEAPEAVQEYRISTNNYSAEYGRTSGFVANAVSRAGSNQYHGIGYWYLKNDALNANGFQENLAGEPRLADKENEIGFQAGGPILRNRLFFSASLDHLRSRSTQSPVDFTFPSTAFSQYTTTSSIASKLLSQFPAPTVNNGLLPTGTLTLAPPVAVDRTLAVARIDYSPNAKDRFIGRLSFARLGEPDFIWSPYRDFISPLDQDTTSFAITWQRSITPALTNEAKLGFSTDNLSWNRAHPEIPSLVSFDGTTLPGSPAFYAYKNLSNTWEILDNVIRAHGRHVTTAGGGVLFRSLSGYLTAGRDGEYAFSNIAFFALDRPSLFSAAVARTPASSTIAVPQLPAYDRDYRYNQFFLFAQDSFKVSSRLTLNYGIRYENYGAPTNTGTAKDDLVQLGSGSTIGQRLASATLTFPTSGDQQIYHSDSGNWAPRFGFAYDLTGRARTVLRGGYGIFYDRPFDNLWQNVRSNNFTVPLVTLSGVVNYLTPVPTVLQGLAGKIPASNFPSLTLMDPSLRNGYAQSFFVGVQHQLSGSLSLEVNTLGALDRRLLTTDIINRDFSTTAGRYNNALPDIAWRSSQGSSNYNALAAVVRYRTPKAEVQASYTWSHSIDNQSDPLVGGFLDLNFTRIGASSAGGAQISAFAEQFNSKADRGNSDFDQRHNFFVWSIFDVPAASGSRWVKAVTEGWRISELAAFRSGFPYTVLAPSIGGDIVNQRADLVSMAANPDTAAPGGRQLLNPANFAIPPAGQLGNTGRNAFRGPGLYNIDLSLSRSFPVKYLGESGRLTVRADAFNFLNHANLNNPDALLTSPTFGLAAFGRTERASGFPAVTPLNETARQLQLILRLTF